MKEIVQIYLLLVYEEVKIMGDWPYMMYVLNLGKLKI